MRFFFLGNLTRGILTLWRICEDLTLLQVRAVWGYKENLCLRNTRVITYAILFIIVIGIYYLKS